MLSATALDADTSNTAPRRRHGAASADDSHVDGHSAAADLEQERSNLAKAYDWFLEANRRGSHELTRTRPLTSPDTEEVRVVSCQSGYGHAALDADALFMSVWQDSFSPGPTTAKLDPAPKRALDIGCGVYAQWILAAAQTVGWEATRFVGLDLAPVLVPLATLPPEIRSRVLFIQQDFLHTLRFSDGAFDYIRCSGVADYIPEPNWDPLIEELKRCLAPGGTLEIVAASSRPIPPPPSLRKEFDAILQKRFLSVNLRSLLPATLAMNDMQRIHHVRGRTVRAPRLPLDRSGPAVTPEDAEVKGRVLLAATAHYTASQTAALAQVIAQARAASLPRASPFSDEAAQRQPDSALRPSLNDQRELEALLRDSTANMHKMASISALMASQWGWTSRVDEEMAVQLHDHLHAAEHYVLETAQVSYRFENGTAIPSLPGRELAERLEENLKDLFLLAVASCAAGAVYHALTARFDEKTRKRALSIGGSALFCMVGLFIMAFPEQLGVRYFGSFLTIMGCQANVPAVIAYQNNNILSHSRRAVAGARTIGARGVGGIIAFTVYRQKDFPKYIPGLEFGFDSTSDEVAVHYAPQIEGKTVLITGVSPNGLGAEAAAAIAQQKPKLLILAGRSSDKIAQTQKTLAELAPGIETKPLILDLASLKKARQAGEEVESWCLAIDVLINNAGVMAVAEREVTEDGYEVQFASNHLGPFVFTTTILPSLKRAPAPRIVNVSSWGHHISPVIFDDINAEKSYDKWARYGQSKTANILFAIGLAKRGLCAVSLHPGAIRTELLRHLTREDELAMGFIKEDGSVGDRFKFKNLKQGAATHIVAAFEPSLQDRGGIYLDDCQIQPDVEAYAVDHENAERLWTLSEELSNVNH
ncbi:hypothetical protein JCM3774_006241 [Rhodotorula dairenensis]